MQQWIEHITCTPQWGQSPEEETLVDDESRTRINRLAVLIDADNARADLVEPLLKEVAKYGTANVKRIYGDWTRSHLASWKEKLNQHAIQPIQQFAYTTGKNATDSALIIDAMDLLYTENFDGFCIVSSDSDFTRLASRIREAGLLVYGFGEQKTPEAFVKACDRFIYTEILDDTDDEVADEVAEGEAASEQVTPTKSVKQKSNKRSGSALRRDRKLVKLLIDAYEATAEEDGWANLGPLGSQLNKLSSSFDARNYGYKKLGELVRAIGLFDVQEIRRGNAVKGIRVCLKSEH